MNKRLIFVALIFLLPLVAGYTDRSFSMRVELVGANAKVTEKTVFNLATQAEKDAFAYTLGLGSTSLKDWEKYSKLVKYHVSGSVFNVRPIAAREYAISYDAASITLEYEVYNVSKVTRLGSRRTHYGLDTSLLLFSASKTGEIVLGNNMELNLVFPQDAVNIIIRPDAGITFEDKTAKWRGPTAGKWDISFEQEIPLNTEVRQFFVDSFGLFHTPYLILGLATLLVALAAYKVLKGRRDK